jgi:hypothetical protein
VAGIKSTWSRFNLLIRRNKGLLSFSLNATTILVAALLLCTTQEQVNLTRKSSEKQLRAYLTITYLDTIFAQRLLTNKHSGEAIILHYAVRNVGQSPAYRFQTNCRLVQQDTILQADFDSLAHTNPSNPIVLNPGVEILDFPTLEAVHNYPLRPRYFFFGVLTFEDTFGATRYVRFCYEYIFRYGIFNPYLGFNEAN